MSVFYGLIMKANFKYTQYVSRAFHISNVALDNGGHAKLYLTYDNKQFLMASMSKKVPQVSLDLNFSPGDRLSFNVEGDGRVSMMGYILNPQPDAVPKGEDAIKEGLVIQQGHQQEQQQEQQQQEQQKLPRAKRTARAFDSKDVNIEYIEYDEDSDKKEDEDDEGDDDDDDDDDGNDDDDEDDDDDNDDDDEVSEQVLKDVAKMVAACEPQVVVEPCQNSHRCNVEAVNSASSSMVGKPRAIRSSCPEFKKPLKLCKYHMCAIRDKRKCDTSPDGSCEWKRYKQCYY